MPVLESSSFSKYSLITDSKTSGTNAQSTIAGTWGAMELTTIAKNDYGIILSLASNEIELAAGEHILDVEYFKQYQPYAIPSVRLWDVTAVAAVPNSVQRGFSANIQNALTDSASPYAFYTPRNKFAIKNAATNKYKIEIVTISANSLGIASSISGVPEIYKHLHIWSK